MDYERFQRFIDDVDQRIRANYGDYDDQVKRTLARAVKLQEEIGELANAVLAHSSFQRDEKLNNYSPDNLGEEFADVIITTYLLAKSMGVDIPLELEKRIKKIEERPKKI